MSYPTMFYKTPGKYRASKHQTFDFIGVNNEAEAKQASKDGYYPTLDEALNPTKPKQGTRNATKERLEQEDNIKEHSVGDEVRETTEASNSNSTKRGRKVSKKV